MIWLGSKRGYLTDWLTQRWVQATGRRVNLNQLPWLNGPIGSTRGIEPDYFQTLAKSSGCELVVSERSGIVPNFQTIEGPDCDARSVQPAVIDFYEQTAAYELDAWAEWCGLIRPFGWLLALLFSRRLQQLNVPLSALDVARGMSSQVLQLVDRNDGQVRQTAWFRRLIKTGHVLYAGFYSVCELPDWNGPCVKVVFPLPNGNAIVIMKARRMEDGSFLLTSSGSGFGQPGFYFTVHGENGVWARYVKAMRESIHVYADEAGGARADHVLHCFGARFLRLHYRMRRRVRRTAEEVR